MVRTQIYLPREQHDYLKLLALQNKITVSELIRQTINQIHPPKKIKAKKKSLAQELLELDTSWFDYDEWKRMRKELNKRPTL